MINKNTQMIEIIALGLKHLLDKVVFTGGATVSLYIEDQGSSEPRPTFDVDCVIEVSYKELAEFEEELNKLGFTYPTQEAPICRWEFSKIQVDFIPLDEAVLGFSNKWHRIGSKNFVNYKLRKNIKIKIFPAPIFIASKFEAFKSRGQKDYRTSQDIEDIVAVLNGREKIYEEIKTVDKTVKKYLVDEFHKILNDRSFSEIIYSHLPINDKDRQDYLVDLIHKLSLLRK